MEFFYRCTECDRQFDIDPKLMLCPDCESQHNQGEPLRGVLEVGFTGSPDTTWLSDPTCRGPVDFGGLLPVDKRFFPPIPVGYTPLWSPSRLQKQSGVPNLYLKDDTANPTGSLKDRASFLVAAFATQHGINDIVVASTGNAASSMAGVGAAAGLAVKIFVPASVPRAKLVQCLQYGADVTIVDGTYDDAFSESLKYTTEHGGLSRNTGYNPLTIEGKKTVALEIFAQLGKMPDVVVVPTGDGVVLGGVFKGFEDLLTLGLADRMPTVVAVQAARSDAICRAVKSGSFAAPVSGETIADSISVGIPANGHGAVRKLERHHGRCVTVTDDEILTAQQVVSSQSGLFPEPAAAASYAGLSRIRDLTDSGSTVVLLMTGTGLKDIKTAGSRLGIET